jgi:hypothetical protein
MMYYKIIITQSSPVLRDIFSKDFLIKAEADCEACCIRKALYDSFPDTKVTVVQFAPRAIEVQSIDEPLKS